MKIAQWTIIYFVTIELLFACNPSDTSLLPAVTDHEVYTAILDYNCQKPIKQQLLIINYSVEKPIINNWSSIPKRTDLVRPTSPIATNTAWQQFTATIDSTKFTMNPLTGSVPSVCYQTLILTGQQENYYFNRGTEALRRDFNGFSSLITFSSVAYSNDHTKAICYRSSVCGGLCGSGDLFFLEQKSTGWTVVEVVGIWIS